MRIWLIAVACVALLAVAAQSGGKSADKADKDRITTAVESKYLAVEAGEVSANIEEFYGRRLQIKDVFGDYVKEIPELLVKEGVSSQAYMAFQTDPIAGSNLFCMVARTNEKLIKRLEQETVVAGTRILLRGKLLRRVGVFYVFEVEEVFRGWEDQPMPMAREVVVSVTADPNTPSVSYPIPELGKLYRIGVPGMREPVYIKVELKETK